MTFIKEAVPVEAKNNMDFKLYDSSMVFHLPEYIKYWYANDEEKAYFFSLGGSLPGFNGRNYVLLWKGGITRLYTNKCFYDDVGGSVKVVFHIPQQQLLFPSSYSEKDKTKALCLIKKALPMTIHPPRENISVIEYDFSPLEEF